MLVKKWKGIGKFWSVDSLIVTTFPLIPWRRNGFPNHLASANNYIGYRCKTLRRLWQLFLMSVKKWSLSITFSRSSPTKGRAPLLCPNAKNCLISLQGNSGLQTTLLILGLRLHVKHHMRDFQKHWNNSVYTAMDNKKVFTDLKRNISKKNGLLQVKQSKFGVI